MSKVHCKQQRKLPVKRLATPSNTSRFTGQELRDAIRHDHCYSLPPLSIDSSMLTPTKLDSVPITLPKDIPLVHFSIEMYKNDNAAITCYTTYDHLMACFNFLGEAVQHLKYPSHSSNAMIRLRQNQSLSPLNEFFLMLCRLKRGLTIQDLAYRFQVSPSTVSRIFTYITWVNFLYKKFLEVPIWPSRNQVDLLMPKEFKMFYPNTRVIIDATEIFIQRPSDPLT